jgi:hypothetical protein
LHRPSDDEHRDNPRSYHPAADPPQGSSADVTSADPDTDDPECGEHRGDNVLALAHESAGHNERSGDDEQRGEYHDHDELDGIEALENSPEF